VNGYAEFVITEKPDRIKKTGHSRLVVEVKPTLYDDNGLYQLCAEVANRFEAKTASGADVFGMLTDTKEFQFFKGTHTSAGGFQIHHSRVITFRAASDLHEDAYEVLGFLFEILGIDENINIKTTHDAILAREEAMKEDMITRARKHRRGK